MKLNTEQLQKAETMPLEELRNLALAEVDTDDTKDKDTPAEQDQDARSRDDKGRFVAKGESDLINNSADEPEAEEEDEPTTHIYRKEIDNADGSGIDVYEADSLEELVDKIAEGKKNANKKIRELSQKVKVEDTRTAQQIEDENYVIKQRFEKEPAKVLEEAAEKVLAKREAAAQASLDAQSRFVTTHPSYVANQKNGTRLTKWLQTNGYTEITVDGLEKAYQDLSSSGLLELKSEEASDATDTNDSATQRTVETKSDVTQQRSQKKSSTISTKNSRTAAVSKANVMPSDDELEKMPLEELRRRADAQLAAANSQD